MTNGLTPYEGQVEMYISSEWKTVCGDEWDELDAKVICRQLVYLSTSLKVEGMNFAK